MTDADASTDIDVLAHGHIEDADDAQGESTSDVEIITASVNEANRETDTDPASMQFDLPLIPSQQAPSVPFSALGEVLHEKAVKRDGFAVVVPPAQNRWEYKVFSEDDAVDEILEEYYDAGFVEYLVLFSDGSEDVVSTLLDYLFNTCYFHYLHLTNNPHIRILLHLYIHLSTVLALSFDADIYVPTHAPFVNANVHPSFLPPPLHIAKPNSSQASQWSNTID